MIHNKIYFIKILNVYFRRLTNLLTKLFEECFLPNSWIDGTLLKKNFLS